ncbi:hypothetical protein QP922_09640 [Corynebacterium sp. MSK218]|uniref:hypothetical protein n=1 Tax=Corynebacterium sp. MSK218 TaxID=3050218 RepID=UPI00254A34DB|nr:hypothetical protein [Corynebacterium sp. MSK218]MDK8764080.1 hypothetical protein [Corynebacterium sp. MSK218]
METNNTNETTNDVVDEVVDTGDDVVDAPADNDTNNETTNDDGKADTFDRAYVEKLRRENADYRARAKDRDEVAATRDDYARRLHTALVRADGRLADPDDLPFDAAHLDDADALTAAIGDLVDRKPGLRARQYGNDVGAGTRGDTPKVNTDLIEIIRGVQGK